MNVLFSKDLLSIVLQIRKERLWRRKIAKYQIKDLQEQFKTVRRVESRIQNPCVYQENAMNQEVS